MINKIKCGDIGSSILSGIFLMGLIWLVWQEIEGGHRRDYESYSGSSQSSQSWEDIELINPYSIGSGHSAGYEWAQENNVTSCGGNSNSFIEGCEEYLSQQEGY